MWSFNTTYDTKKQSKMFADFDDKLLEEMSKKEIAFHYHSFGVSVNDYLNLHSLLYFYKVISTDVTNDGKPFVTAIEAYDYPIFGLQYHPEYQMMQYLTEDTLNTQSNYET